MSKDSQSKQPPWYKQYDTWKKKALSFIEAFEESDFSNEQKEQIKSYYYQTVCQLIFESNSIEGVGTKTLGETKKIINEVAFISKAKPVTILEHFLSKLPIQVRKREESKIVSYNKSNKEYNEVAQHLDSLNKALEEYLVFEDKKNKTELVTTQLIKDLHKTIAKGLISNAGEFRNFDDIIIVERPELTFPSHKLLALSIDEFCKRSNNAIMKNIEDNKSEVFIVAAQVSYEFVRIHPFEDFNGRISRILLQLVLLVFGMPFFIPIKGNKKSRHRYMEALKRANAIKDPENFDKTHLEPYATLIAMAVCDSFEELNTNLRLAGLPIISSTKPF